MFEKLAQSAEKVVSKVSVSRRGFLGRVAKGAAVLGAALAGLAPSRAEAARRGSCGCPVYYVPYCFYDNGQAFPAAHGCSCPNVKGAKVVGRRCILP